MLPVILLVDDQREILRLLRSTLDTIGHKLEILEAPSGEEAMLESSRHKIDLLVTDYKLPGMTGIQLMSKIRVRHPEIKTILISGIPDRKIREEMMNAGAQAVFDKPVPLADFLDMVERCLGLVQTIFPPEQTKTKDPAQQVRLSDLLANFRQDINAQAVLLLNDRGRVLTRAGDLRDSSMEVSIVSAVAAIHGASLKLARFNRQNEMSSYHAFSGGDHDLIFIPVSATYVLLLAGSGLAAEDRILDVVRAMMRVRVEIEKSLKALTGAAETSSTEAPAPVPASAPVKSTPVYIPPPPTQISAEELAATPPSPELEALLKGAIEKKTAPQNAGSFWDDAAEKMGSKPTKPDIITYEEARKLGLTPGKE